MVRICITLAVLLPGVLSAEPIDETWLRDQLAPAEAEHARRQARTKVADGLTVDAPKTASADDQSPAAAAPEQKQVNKYTETATTAEQESPNETSPPEPARVNKYGTGTPAKSGKAPAHNAMPSDPDIYIPPPRVNTVSTTRSTVFNNETRTFGIVLGTWARAHIERRVSNADNGPVEVILDEDINGNKRDLPAGTVLFGPKGFNQTAQRLDVTLTHGITPDGSEFDISATVYDAHKVSGLTGSVVRQRGDEIRSAASSGALASAQTLMATTIDSAAAGAVVDSIAQTGSELLNNEQQYVRTPRAFIQESPQPVFIRIDQTF